MKHIRETHDLVVAGGGLAGFCAALSAARLGLKSCLVQERPVLGGVASSEICVSVHGSGCHHPYARETGIIGEILAEERARNHATVTETGWTNSVFDLTLYDLAMREPNLRLHLNAPVVDVVMDQGASVDVPPHTDHGYFERPACNQGRRITALAVRPLASETLLTLQASEFVDATGDGFLADRAGCGWRMGSEGRDRTGERNAPPRASTDTLGSSILFRARDVGREAPFTPPPWAALHVDPDFFYKQGRRPWDRRGGYWWIELGVPWHTIHDNETLRHELTRHVLGIWNWMKNLDPVMRVECRNWALDFIGQVPGKRESRRILGRHWLDEHQIRARTRHPDEVAYGGWFLDLHTPGGLLAPTSEVGAAEGHCEDSEYAAQTHVGPYGLPLRSLMAADIDNLYLAGRCLSASRAALGTVRVMGTTALMGQAVGTAIAIARRRGLDLPALERDAAAGGPAIRAIQQRLLRDGGFLPNVANEDPTDLARAARVSASSEAVVQGQELGPSRDGDGAMPANCGRMAGQLICLAGGRLDRMELHLRNAGAEAAQVPVRLIRHEGYWDYRADGAGVVAEGMIPVAARHDGWAIWEPGLSGLVDGWYRLEAGPASGITWRRAQEMIPGHVAVFANSPTRRRFRHHGQAFRIHPAQPVFAAGQVLTGVARPGRGTNLWRSDPDQPMPQWLELAWEESAAIASVEITFAGQILQGIHGSPGFTIDAETVRDYRVEIDTGDGSWREALRVAGNFQRHRRHRLPQAEPVRRLRLVIEATNGDPAAAVHEIRCYGPES